MMARNVGGVAAVKLSMLPKRRSWLVTLFVLAFLVNGLLAGYALHIYLPRSLAARVNSLEQEARALSVELETLRSIAGYLPLTGTGVRVRVFDAFRSAESAEIVHDGDIRDVVNELFAAGAKGIAVGNQRLIANSSIRCAGPVILVNHRPIAVNPVVIEAVGESQVLKSGLQIVSASLLATRGVQVRVEVIEKLTIPAFAPLR